MSKYLFALAFFGLWATGLGYGAGTLNVEGQLLLSTNVPGAYAVRYWPDRIVLSYEAKEAVRLQIYLPEAPRWASLDGAPWPRKNIVWAAAQSCVQLSLPAGKHLAHIAWKGSFQRPARAQTIPVLCEGKNIGQLRAHFSLEEMTAQGAPALPAALVLPCLRLKPSAPAALAPQLSMGHNVIAQWRRTGQFLQAASPLVCDVNMPVQLVVTAYALAASPVEAIELRIVQKAMTPQRLTAMPAAGIVIEAEDFVAEGRGKVAISERHYQTHGGKSIYQNSGEGHWLEYKFVVPQTGLYDLYVRGATEAEADLRSIKIDGQTPPGLGLIRFPGTGGWGYSAEEWAAWQLTGLPRAPSLKLDAGEHVLRLTGESSTHLNLDYFLLVPRF